MSASASYTLTLAKEDFKFSCGHFTLFDEERAEELHGHNYQVAVEFTGPAPNEEGLLVDFVAVKRAIRKTCARLDSHTLIPRHSPHLRITEEDGTVEIVFRDRCYRLPVQDVLLLPLRNTSIELLARMLWEEWAEELEVLGITTLGVRVSETAGQDCWYRALLSDHSAATTPQRYRSAIQISE